MAFSRSINGFQLDAIRDASSFCIRLELFQGKILNMRFQRTLPFTKLKAIRLRGPRPVREGCPAIRSVEIKKVANGFFGKRTCLLAASMDDS